MKKLLALLLALALMLSLVSCGGAQKSTDTTEPADTAADTADDAAATDDAATDDAEATEAADTAEDATEAPAAPPTDSTPGTYRLIGMSQEGMTYDEKTIASLESAGMICYLQLKEDGSGLINIFDDVSEFQWEGTSFKMDDETVPFTLEGGVLSLEKDGSSMTFRKETDDIIELTANLPTLDDYKAMSANVSDAIPGTYHLYAMNTEGEEMSEEDLQSMGSMYALMLKEDGTGTFYIFGFGMDITWKDDSLTILSTGEGDEDTTIAFTFKDHILSIDEDGTSMSFIKTSDEIEEYAGLSLDALGEMIGDAAEEDVEIIEDTTDAN